MKESSLQRKCLEILKLMRTAGEPIYWFKVHGSQFQRPGVPDLLIWFDGLAAAAELKTGNNTTNKRQDVEIERMRNAGVFVEVVGSVEDFQSLIDVLRNNA